MGKAALLMVIASTITMVGVSTTRITTEIEAEETQTDYVEKVLAREAATSFFNVLAGKSVKNFDSFRVNHNQLTYHDAVLSFSAVSNATDEVGLSAVAFVGDASHSIMGTVVRSGGGGLLDALTVDGPLNISGANGSSFLITGDDTNPGEEIGSGPETSTYGVRAIEEDAASEIRDNIDGSQIQGLYGENSLVTGSSGLDLDALHSEIMNYPGATVMNGNQTMKGNNTFASQGSPGIMIVNGDFEMKGNSSGYGILLVNGNFTAAKGTPKWEGLVYVMGDGANSMLKGTVDVYGAMILRSETDEDDPNPADFYINGNVNLMYSSLALSRMPAVLPSLNAAPPVVIAMGEIREYSSSRHSGSTDYSSYNDYTSDETGQGNY